MMKNMRAFMKLHRRRTCNVHVCIKRQLPFSGRNDDFSNQSFSLVPFDLFSSFSVMKRSSKYAITNRLIIPQTIGVISMDFVNPSSLNFLPFTNHNTSTDDPEIASIKLFPR